MSDSRVFVHDQEGKAWQVEPTGDVDVGTFARRLLMAGNSATAILGEGHFVLVPSHAIARIEVMPPAER